MGGLPGIGATLDERTMKMGWCDGPGCCTAWSAVYACGPWWLCPWCLDHKNVPET